MPDIVIKPVRSWNQRRQFLNYLWTIYRDDPNWIPPLRMDQKERVNYIKHPFYDEAEIETFLAFRGKQVVGRIAAIVNHAHNRIHKDQLGFFGFFESIDDSRVGTALLAAAWQWLAERGMTAMRGPVNPSQNYECGLLVDGFDSPPCFMMTYNPPYYERMLEEFGCRKSQDLYAFWGHVNMLDTLDEKVKFIAQLSRERFEIVVRPMNKKKFRQEVEMFLDIYNQAMGGSWGFVPLSLREIEHLSKGLRYLIEPRLALVGEVNGKPIGAVFGLLDYNPRIKAMDGKLFPFGFLKLITRRRELKNIRLISSNVVPEYQRWGAGLVLLSGLMPMVRDWGIQEAEFSWVMESNKLSRGSLERGGAKLTKTYRLYDYAPA